MTNIRDLAKMAGVSVTTVSRVLNGHPYVSEAKRQAVQAAIAASQYRRNMNAVHLSKGNTMLIGVVLPSSGHPYFARLLKGIARQAFAHNYKLVLFQTDYQESREREALEMLKYKQIDALIICSRACGLGVIREHLAFGPIVLCENNHEIASTFVDHYKVFKEALAYLYEKGHRRVGYCIGRKSGANSQQRQAAYVDFLDKYGLPYREDYVMADCLYLEDGAHVIEQLQQLSEPPSALLVTSDQVAAGIVMCCQSRGISIPDELALIGFNNESIAKVMNITTVAIPLEEMGEQLFLQAISGERSHQEIAVQLIERGTA